MSQDPAASYGLTRNNFTAGGGDKFGILTQGTDRVVGLADPAALISPVESLPQPFGAALEGASRSFPEPPPLVRSAELPARAAGAFLPAPRSGYKPAIAGPRHTAPAPASGSPS